MTKLCTITGMILLAATSTGRSADCGTLSIDIVKLVSWSAKKADYGSVDVNLKMENISGKDFRLLKGGVRFFDPFDEHIVSLAIFPDVKVNAGAHFDQNGSFHAARLATIDPSDVTAIVCIEGVVFSDGNKESFK